jgi:hypothetical protein
VAPIRRHEEEMSPGNYRFLIHPEIKMQPGATVTVLQPFPGHVDLFVTDPDGAVWSTFFEPDGGWRNWFLIP